MAPRRKSQPAAAAAMVTPPPSTTRSSRRVSTLLDSARSSRPSSSTRSSSRNAHNEPARLPLRSSTRKNRASQKSVADSVESTDELSGDMDPDIGSQPSSARKSHPSVVIPVTSVENTFITPVTSTKNSAKGKAKAQVGDSVGERSSSLSSTDFTQDGRGRATEYETPGTSAVPTPAEPMFGGGSKPSQRVTTAERFKQLQNSPFALNSTYLKRKREAEEKAADGEDEEMEDVEDLEEEESADARLAQRLQDEENMKVLEDDAGPSSSRRGRGRRNVLPDSDDSSIEELSEPPSVLETPEPLPKSKRTRRAPVDTPRQSARPSRAAGESARKSIASSLKNKVDVGDSEGSAFELSDAPESDQENFDDLTSNQAADSPAISDEVTFAIEDELPVATPWNPRARIRALDKIRRQRKRDERDGNIGFDVSTRGGERVRVPIPEGKITRAERERFKLEYFHPEVSTMWDTLAAVPVIEVEEAEQPKSITRQLKSFQLEGLNWMIKQEQSQWKGGLLGDEMGMGKTIQAVSLIMSDYPAKSPTLVVVPPVALMQWQNEIRSYTDGKLKVLLYHGPQAKKMSFKELKTYDVWMTSYSTLEAIFRKERKGWVRKDEDGEKILIKEDSPLHAVKFHRIILDEAHNIKSRTSGTAKASFALQADYKWCLSGTPLQNRIGELFSLLRFLGVQPFACYMCKACSCKEVHWALDNATKQCKICKHRGFDHVSIFNTELLDPIINYGNDGLGKEAFQKLRILMSRIMLRRLKADHSASMELPSKSMTIHNEFFGEIERDFASSIMSNTRRQFNTYVAQGVMLNNYANIFGLIMQMRQVADHPDMILRKHAEGGQNILVCCICDDAAEDCVRSGCRHDFCRDCVRNYMRSFTENEDPDCPRCHIPLSIDLEQEEREQDEQAVKKSSIINRIKMERWTSSTKIEMLIYELAEMRGMKRTHKSIVFSQFTSMLQLVEWRLRRAGFNTVMLDGTMTPTQRQSSIDYFMNTPDVEVFLVSLKAGGVALNLTEASRVYLIDPWWNPAAEWQSADRCHRIGQNRSVTIVRLVIEDSVESRMVLLQEKKANMINGTINSDETAMQNLSPEDMQFLFRGS